MYLISKDITWYQRSHEALILAYKNIAEGKEFEEVEGIKYGYRSEIVIGQKLKFKYSF